MISAVVLAAGSSTRMTMTTPGDKNEEKVHKLLLPLGDKTIVEHVVDSALESQVGEVLVIVGYGSQKVAEQLADRNISIIVNNQYHQGQSTSVRKGVESVSSASQGSLFLLGDQPFIPATLIDQVIARKTNFKCDICYPLYNGKRGNPVLFGAKLYQELLAQTGDKGGRGIIDSVSFDCHCQVETEEQGVLMDVDTYQDYLEAVEYYITDYHSS